MRITGCLVALPGKICSECPAEDQISLSLSVFNEQNKLYRVLSLLELLHPHVADGRAEVYIGECGVDIGASLLKLL